MKGLIKVCGMRNPENMQQVAALGIDMMGFIFYDKSRRYVGIWPAGELPTGLRRVGVFVDAPIDRIEAMVENWGLDMVQLHGNEMPDFCRELAFKLPSVGIIKAFSISTAEDFEQTADYEGVAQMFLFDTATPGYGGSGRSFDWSQLELYRGQTPFLLSGGIGPRSVDALKKFSHPRCCGVDLNSRFEITSAYKDVDAIKTFIQEYRES